MINLRLQLCPAIADHCNRQLRQQRCATLDLVMIIFCVDVAAEDLKQQLLLFECSPARGAEIDWRETADNQL